MDQLRGLLDTLDRLLTTEPARLIGYGAAVIITLVVAFANSQGITRFGADLTFEQAMTLAFSAIATVTLVVESIRRFVYAPATVLDVTAEAHEDGHTHAEETLAPLVDGLVQRVKAAEAPQQNPIPAPSGLKN